MVIEYCPNCIVPLVKDKKKLGNFTLWLKCNQCGYRTRPKSEFVKNKELEEFYTEKNRINNKFMENE